MSGMKSITIITEDFFPAWIYAVCIVVLILGGVLIYFLGNFFLLFAAVIFSFIVWFSKKYFEFSPDKREYRNGFYFLGLKTGEWKSLEIEKGYLAFQRYGESVNYSFGGLFRTDVQERIFELRIVYPDGTFYTLVTGRDVEAVTKILQMGKMLAALYRVDFKDFVKGTIGKEVL
jgi:hypothetical protein